MLRLRKDWGINVSDVEVAKTLSMARLCINDVKYHVLRKKFNDYCCLYLSGYSDDLF